MADTEAISRTLWLNDGSGNHVPIKFYDMGDGTYSPVSPGILTALQAIQAKTDGLSFTGENLKVSVV